MSEIIKITSNISIFDTDQSTQLKKLFDQVLLLQPSNYYNGKKLLKINATNSLVGQDSNSLLVFSTNGYPFSLTMTSSGGAETISQMTNLYTYSFVSNIVFDFEIFNESTINDVEIVFFIGINEILSNSYVYS